MREFMQHAAGVMKKYADKIALLDGQRAMTYREMDEESGKVYAWLKEQGIGREDFVHIVLPRGVSCVSALLGVLKAGAAFQLMEDSYPQKRIAFIRQDVGAKMVLDEKTYKQIMEKFAPLSGFEKTAPHDAAFAVYTSGSTGNPKGILHEYGNLPLIASYLEEQPDYRPEPMAMAAPMTFVAAIFYFLSSFRAKCPMYIVPLELYRDLNAFAAFLEREKVHHLFLPPSYIRLYKNPSPGLEWIMVGSEPTNGIYYEGGKPRILSHYTMSEAGFPVLNMFLDKSYEHSLLGRPVLAEADVHLEDSDGNRVEGVGEGEICFRNEYVRGYINLPEKTASVFRNGYYYTGDIARRDEQGIFTFVGRNDDMVKINGNRVEPGEIEGAFRQVTGLKNAVAKAFVEAERAFVCLYYLREEAERLGILQGDKLTADLSPMEERLPHYMLPAYYVPLDAFPRNERGKLVRRELKPPAIKVAEGEYVSPESEGEQVICKLMAEILSVEKVGAESDFYLLGGDSLRTIRLAALAEERGYALRAGDIYAARTPRKIALLLEKGSGLGQAELRGLEDIRQHFAEDWQKYLSTGEMDSYTGSFFTRNKEEVMSAAAGINLKFTLKEAVDGERLVRAVQEAVKACPYVAFGLHFHEGVPRLTFRRLQCRDGSLGEGSIPVFKGYLPKRFDEAELQGHFAFISYQGCELTICICHAITDGNGFMKFAHKLFEAYGGGEVSFEPGLCYGADVMKYEWPLPKDFRPEGELKQSQGAEEIFKMPWPEENEGSLCRQFLIERKAFEDCRGRMGLSSQGLAAYILARALQMAVPANEKTLRIRCPIDTRNILGVQGTFQNASVPHMYLDFRPEGLLPFLPREEAERLSSSFYRQLSYEHAAYLTNLLAGAAKADAEGFKKVILDYVAQSNLCVSYIGGAAGEAMEKVVVKLEPAYQGQPPFPVMLYFWEMGEKISIQYAQGGTDEAYIEAIEKTLGDLGINIL